jgi:hypothetical protein
MFVSRRQFASAVGTDEVDVPVPANPQTAPDGTTVYPASVWHKREICEGARPGRLLLDFVIRPGC